MKYRSTPPPDNQHSTEVLLRWIRDELLEVEAALDHPETDRINLSVRHSEPDKPREGDLVRADGTDWNPGAGEGVYEYTAGGSWSKL